MIINKRSVKYYYSFKFYHTSRISRRESNSRYKMWFVNSRSSVQEASWKQDITATITTTFPFFFFLRNAWSPFCQDVNKKVGLVEKVRAAGDVFHAFISDVPPNSIHREYLVRISPSSNFLAGIIRGVSFFKETLERESPPIFPFYFLEFINDRRRFITPWNLTIFFSMRGWKTFFHYSFIIFFFNSYSFSSLDIRITVDDKDRIVCKLSELNGTHTPCGRAAGPPTTESGQPITIWTCGWN